MKLPVNTMYRLARRRQRRHADVQAESRAEELGGRLKTTESSHGAHFCNLSVDNDKIIHKIQQFHGSLAALGSILCIKCLEQFPSINVKFIMNRTMPLLPS